MLTRTLALSMVKSTPETQPTYRPRQLRQQRHQPFRLDVESEAMVDTLRHVTLRMTMKRTQMKCTDLLKWWTHRLMNKDQMLRCITITMMIQ